jgi:hypothetical protein
MNGDNLFLLKGWRKINHLMANKKKLFLEWTHSRSKFDPSGFAPINWEMIELSVGRNK